MLSNFKSDMTQLTHTNLPTLSDLEREIQTHKKTHQLKSTKFEQIIILRKPSKTSPKFHSPTTNAGNGTVSLISDGSKKG
jgi:hypothetical protein